MNQEEAKAEFDNFRKVLDVKQQELDKNCLRSLEHKAYLKAAKCTEDSTRGTFEVRDCVKSSFDQLEHAQKLFQQKQNQINQAMQVCQQACENQIKLEAPSGPANMSQEEQDKFQQKYMTCVSSCPRSNLPLVESAFKNLTETLSSMK